MNLFYKESKSRKKKKTLFFGGAGATVSENFLTKDLNKQEMLQYVTNAPEGPL